MLLAKRNVAVILFAMGLTIGAPLHAAPTPASSKDKQTPADGQPRPWRVLNDRRVPFPLNALTFSRDGKVFAAVGAAYAPGALGMFRVVIVDAATGETLHQIETYTVAINHFVFSPDGKTLYAGWRNNADGL